MMSDYIVNGAGVRMGGVTYRKGDTIKLSDEQAEMVLYQSRVTKVPQVQVKKTPPPVVKK